MVTLRSPSSGSWSSIAETTDATAAQQVTYQVAGGLSTGPVHVWATNMNSSDPGQWFRDDGSIQPQGGSFTLTLQPGYLYTVTTTTGQHKGSAAPPPASPWQLPYTEDFSGYRSGAIPRYFSDLGGSFETAPCQPGQAGPAPAGMCLQQMVTAQPVQWNTINNYPVTVVGDPSSWRNYDASVDAVLNQPGHVELDGRALSPTNGLTGYHFQISDTGNWSLFSQNASGSDTTLASGTASFGIGNWHRLGLEMRGDEITASLDGHALATVVDNAYQFGQVGLATSAWAGAQFGNLSVRPVPVSGQGPAIAAPHPDPVVIAAPGDSATFSTAITNPGQPAATAVTAKVQAPAGWTASPVTAPPATLDGGQTAPASWQLTAPATASPGEYQATVTVTYSSGGLNWVSAETVPVDLAVVPQNQMTATASSAQSGYPASNAIDGNPATLWHTEYSPDYAAPPQSITLDLGGSYDVRGLLYLPRQDGNSNGIITSYNIYASNDGTTWTQVDSGDWAATAAQKSASFTASGVRYIRLEGVQGHNGYVSAAEINVVGSAVSSQGASRAAVPVSGVSVQAGRLSPAPAGISEAPGRDGQVRYGQAIRAWWNKRGPERPAGHPLRVRTVPGDDRGYAWPSGAVPRTG